MNQQRQHDGRPPGAPTVLAGPGDAHRDRVHRLQMAGVLREQHSERVGAKTLQIGNVAAVVFHVAPPWQGLGVVACLELTKRRLKGFPEQRHL